MSNLNRSVDVSINPLKLNKCHVSNSKQGSPPLQLQSSSQIDKSSVFKGGKNSGTEKDVEGTKKKAEKFDDDDFLRYLETLEARKK
jgi:hypothetical protein